MQRMKCAIPERPARLMLYIDCACAVRAAITPLTAREEFRLDRRRIFTRRSGKVLASSRAVLVLLFILALVLDREHPVEGGLPGIVLLSGYSAWSLLLVVISWRSWWLDCRIAPAAHALDLCVFIGAVFITEGANSEFVSPFLAFAAYLLIVAMVRWGWTGVAITAAAMAVANACAAVAYVGFGHDLNLYRFGRRQTYMIALSIMMIWLSGDRRNIRTLRLPDVPGAPGERRELVLAGALKFASATMSARSVAIAIGRSEEPWIDVLVLHENAVTKKRSGPGALTDAAAAGDFPTLFDIRRFRRIQLIDEQRLHLRTGRFAAPLAKACGVKEGIIAPFSSATSQGQLLLWDIPGICADDLPWVSALAYEIGLALDREEMAMLAKSSAVSNTRKALARDLHDSVAQFLAGTLFRIEALRRWIREGNDPEREIIALKEALRREQGHLRVLIDRLRRGEEGDRPVDLVEEMESLLEEMRQHWHIDAQLAAETNPLQAPVQLAHEVRQLVREAVANAARHGRCDRVDIAITRRGPDIWLTIMDDGIGLPIHDGAVRPRSISERVEVLGGRLTIRQSTPNSLRPGTRLDIELPSRMVA